MVVTLREITAATTPRPCSPCAWHPSRSGSSVSVRDALTDAAEYPHAKPWYRAGLR